MRLCPPEMRPVLLLALVAALACGCGRKAEEPLTPEQIRTEPLTAYLKIDGGFYVLRDPWHFFIDTKKGTWFTIIRYPHKSQEKFDLTDAQLSALREALIREDFFGISQKEYGEEPGDDGMRGIRVTVGGRLKNVNLLNLDNWRAYDEQTLSEIRRVLRVWRVVRDWFDAPAIMDFRARDDEILAGKPGGSVAAGRDGRGRFQVSGFGCQERNGSGQVLPTT